MSQLELENNQPFFNIIKNGFVCNFEGKWQFEKKVNYCRVEFEKRALIWGQEKGNQFGTLFLAIIFAILR